MLLNNADPELCHKFMHTLGILLYNGVTHYKLMGQSIRNSTFLLIYREKMEKIILHAVGGKLILHQKFPKISSLHMLM